jgi:hypothetical protein
MPENLFKKATKISQNNFWECLICSLVLYFVLQERFPDSKIFLADFNIPVYWGHVSMLNAELNCLEQLEQR